MVSGLETFLNIVVDHSILLFELMGVGVIIGAGIRGAWDCFQRSEATRLKLAQGMALGLEFKLGSEILRTVIVRDTSEMFVVAGIIILRAALTFLIHWEIKVEKE